VLLGNDGLFDGVHAAKARAETVEADVPGSDTLDECQTVGQLDLVHLGPQGFELFADLASGTSLLRPLVVVPAGKFSGLIERKELVRGPSEVLLEFSNPFKALW